MAGDRYGQADPIHLEQVGRRGFQRGKLYLGVSLDGKEAVGGGAHNEVHGFPDALLRSADCEISRSSAVGQGVQLGGFHVDCLRGQGVERDRQSSRSIGVMGVQTVQVTSSGYIRIRLL